MSSPLIEEIGPGVYELTGAVGDKRLAIWLLVGDGEVAVVDTGVAETVERILRPALDALGAAPEDVRDVLITHADVDHFGGVAAARAAFPRAALRATAPDRPLIERWETAVGERYGWYRAHGLDYDAAVWDALPALTGPDTPLDGTICAGQRVTCGAASFEVLALPGHTAGHVGLWSSELRLAIVADALLADGVPDADGRLAGPPCYVSAPAYRTTIGAIERLGARELRTSHWPVAEGCDVAGFVHRSRAFTNRLENAVLTALRRGPRSLAELWLDLSERLGPFPALGVELARSIHSHLEDLEARGRIERRSGVRPRWAARRL